MTKKKKAAEKKMAAEAICPCGKPVETHKCRFCGATKSINQASGHVIWMRNGRVVRAFQDEKKAYVEMAEQYGIPEAEWPEQFRT
jgi:ribosomal protein L24E